MKQSDALDYEIRSSWWASKLDWTNAQCWAGRYYAWKVNRKWARYQQNIESTNEMQELRNEMAARRAREAVGSPFPMPESDPYEYDHIKAGDLRVMEVFWGMAMHSGWKVHKAVSVLPDGSAYEMTLKRKKEPPSRLTGAGAAVECR